MSDEQIINGDRVIHPKYGTGEVVSITTGTVMDTLVEFDRSKRQLVDRRDLEHAREMLKDVTVRQKPEWADEPVDDEEPLYGGEVEIELDFADDVEYDVDVTMDTDGRIIVQYWDES